MNKKDILMLIAEQTLGRIFEKAVYEYSEYLKNPSIVGVGGFVLQYKFLRGVTLYRKDKDGKLIKLASASYRKLKTLLNIIKLIQVEQAIDDLPF